MFLPTKKVYLKNMRNVLIGVFVFMSFFLVRFLVFEMYLGLIKNVKKKIWWKTSHPTLSTGAGRLLHWGCGPGPRPALFRIEDPSLSG